MSASAEGLFDARLFNQSQGMDSGFGNEDDYNVYTKGLRSEKAQSIYRPKAEDNGLGTADEEVRKQFLLLLSFLIFFLFNLVRQVSKNLQV